MKTTVSISDRIFEEAERFARQRGGSRSELYANALTEYIEAHKYTGVRERLDTIYRDARREDSALDPVLERIQALSLLREEW